MIERLQIYRCETCGNIVEVMHVGGGQLVCCGKPMKLLAENASDGAKEKHVPMVEKTVDGFKVTVGSVAHPMEADHYIEWIELVALGADGAASASHVKFLAPGDKPEATFAVKAASACAREYCNKHGLWKA